MSDIISRKAAIEALKEHRNLFCDNTPETFSVLPYGDKCRVDELDMAIATLINLPPAQPERKKGKWKKALTKDLIGFNTRFFRCSECNGMEYSTPPFCRMCGAEMEGQDE